MKIRFYKHISIITSSSLRYQPFVTVFANLGGKLSVFEQILSSHKQKNYRTTSLDEDGMEFEFQTDRNDYVDLKQNYWALKLNLVTGGA